MTHIFTYTSPQDTVSLAAVCKDFYEVARSEYVWQSHYQQRVIDARDKSCEEDFDRNYFQIFVADQFFNKAIKLLEARNPAIGPLAHELLINAAYGGSIKAQNEISKLLIDGSPYFDLKWKHNLLPQESIKSFFDQQFGIQPISENKIINEIDQKFNFIKNNKVKLRSQN